MNEDTRCSHVFLKKAAPGSHNSQGWTHSHLYIVLKKLLATLQQTLSQPTIFVCPTCLCLDFPYCYSRKKDFPYCRQTLKQNAQADQDYHRWYRTSIKRGLTHITPYMYIYTIHVHLTSTEKYRVTPLRFQTLLHASSSLLATEKEDVESREFQQKTWLEIPMFL
jgi:hypothetical protein